MRKITEISEVKTAKNGSTYVELIFGMCVENMVVKPQEMRCLFAPEDMLALVEVGMEMEVKPLN